MVWQIRKVDAFTIAPTFQARPTAGIVDKNPSHGFGGRREEMPSIIPLWIARCARQPQVRFVHQHRRLQRLAWLFLGELLGGKFTKLVVHQGQQLLGGLRIAMVDGVQDSGDFVHAASARRLVAATAAIIAGLNSTLPEAPIDGPGRVPETLLLWHLSIMTLTFWQ